MTLDRLRQCASVLRAQQHPWWFVIGRVLMASGLSPLFRIRRDGFSLRFYDSSLSLALWLRDDPGLAEQLFSRYLRAGDVVIDVGANVGLHSLLCATRVGASGRVFALEPSPRTAGFLAGNIALNGLTNVQVFNAAVGDRTGVALFSDQSQDDQNRVLETGAGQQVPLLRLDDLTLPDGPIGLLKIDVEGYEKFVLDGARAVLRQTECVFIETWEEHFAKYGYSCTDVHARLREAGFTLFLLRQEQMFPVQLGYISRHCEDVVAVRDVNAFVERTGYTLLERNPS